MSSFFTLGFFQLLNVLIAVPEKKPDYVPYEAPPIVKKEVNQPPSVDGLTTPLAH